MAFSSRVLRALVSSFEELQFPSADLLMGLELEPLLKEDHAWIPDVQFYEVVRRALQVSQDPALGLHIGERGNLSAFGAAGMLISVLPTFRDAMDALIQFHVMARYQQDIFVREDGGDILILLERFDAAGSIRRCISELVLALLAQLLKRYAGQGGVARSVEFDFPAPEYTDEYRRIFGCEVRFDTARAAMLVPGELANRPQLLSDPDLAAELRRRVESWQLGAGGAHPLVERVRSHVRASLRTRAKTMEAIALGLGMSPRSLHRHLARHGVDYRSILDEARLTAAAALLRDQDLSVKRVAHEVGFSNPSAFYRAFKRWTGYSPTEYAELEKRRWGIQSGTTALDFHDAGASDGLTPPA
jgi:AraC-like DNA-binding protein